MLSMALETFPNLIGDHDQESFVRLVHNEIDTLIAMAQKGEKIEINQIATTALEFHGLLFSLSITHHRIML